MKNTDVDMVAVQDCFTEREVFLCKELQKLLYRPENSWYHSVGLTKRLLNDNTANTWLVVYINRPLKDNDAMIPAIFGELFVCIKRIGKVEPE